LALGDSGAKGMGLLWRKL